jgi:pre-mRNA-splicing factor 38B
MRSTTNQMELMLSHADSPYIRATGFLYLRYTCEPEHLFKWFQPYLYDEEPIQVTAGKKTAGGGRNHHGQGETIGTFVRSLLSSTNRDYYGTMLPRLPIQIERDVQVQLLKAEKVQKRAESHFRNKSTMDYFQKLGSKIMATYEDDENALQWYQAEIDRVVLRGEDGNLLKHPKFVVTFTQYGNTETVFLGEMDVLDGPFYREDTRGIGGGRARGGHHDRISDSRGGGGKDLYEEVRRREQDKATGSRGNYFSRIETTKNSLAGGGGGRGPPPDRRRRSPSPSRARKHSPPTTRDGERSFQKEHKGDEGRRPQSQSPPPRKRTAEELIAIQEKKRKLAAKYG